MARPVCGVRGLFRFDPRAGDIREIGNARSAELDAAQPLLERAEDGLHHRRVEGVRSEQAAAGDGLLRERLFVSSNRICRAGDDAHRGIVDGGERKILGQLDLSGGKRHGPHRARRQVVDEPSARSDNGERIFKREDAGQARGYVFANAVTGHRGRLNTKRSPPLGERVFNREERGLR